MPKKKETPKEVQAYLDNIRDKPLRKIAKEGEEALREAIKADEEGQEKITPVEEKVTAEKKVPVEEKPAITSEDIKKAAKEAAQESTRELKEEIQKIRESDRTKEEKKEKIEELKARWTGFDKDTGTQTPKDYDEIVSESRRLAFEDYKKFYKEQKEAELAEINKIQEEDKKSYDAALKQINSHISREMEELYQTGYLKRPKDVNDLTDPAARKVKELFDQAATENVKRREDGKELIDSIAKFYFMYYKEGEEKQLPGAQAPISGASAVEKEEPAKLDYFRDIHNPSYRQIVQKGQNQIKKILRLTR